MIVLSNGNKPKMSFNDVQKRINTRIFSKSGRDREIRLDNPVPGKDKDTDMDKDKDTEGV